MYMTETDWSNGQAHIDIWTGSNTEGGGQAQIDCEDNLTSGGQFSIVRQPPNNLVVNSMYSFASFVSITKLTWNSRCLIRPTKHLQHPRCVRR
jgi:hypothetical protein